MYGIPVDVIIFKERIFLITLFPQVFKILYRIIGLLILFDKDALARKQARAQACSKYVYNFFHGITSD
jgi:hypothetical protein